MDSDVVSDEIVERREFQLQDVGRAYEEDPLLLLQRLVRKGANSLALAGTQVGKNSVALAADDHHPTAIPGEVFDGGVLAHGREDLPEDFDAETRRLVIAQVFEGRQIMSDEPQ